MKHNPLGMVPTLVSEATFKEDPSLGPMKPPVRESLVAIEFVDEIVGGGVCPSTFTLSQRLNSPPDCFCQFVSSLQSSESRESSECVNER